ncbi:MAG: hypothetical protein WB392_04495, partial [Methanotrichaceae archaeon]
ALTNPVTGTGTNSYIAAWNGTNQIQTAAPYGNGPWYIAGKVIDTGSLQVTDSINITPTGYANPFSIHEGVTYYLQYLIGADDDNGLLTNHGSFENADWIRTDSIATRAANITSMSAGQIPYMGSTGLSASIVTQASDASSVTLTNGILKLSNTSDQIIRSNSSSYDLIFQTNNTVPVETFRIVGATQSLQIAGTKHLSFTDANTYINASSSGNLVLSGSSISLNFGATNIVTIGYGGAGFMLPLLAPASNFDMLNISASGGLVGHVTIAAGTIPMGSATTGLAASILSQSSHVVTVAGELAINYDLQNVFLSTAIPTIYTTDATTPGTTPFDMNGSLVIQPRTTAARHIIFATYDGVSVAERARITAAGNLGIGNAAPGNTLTLGTSGGTASFGITDVQTVTMTGDQNLTPTCTRIELNGTHNAALLAGSLPNGTLLIITHGGTGYPTVTFNGHNYTIDANHSFLFFKNSAGNWYPLTPYTS